MLVTNNMIREILGLPAYYKEFQIHEVDGLDVHLTDTLMFINKSNVNTELFDITCGHCVFLIDESYPEIGSVRNDFIRVANPKFEFCRVVSALDLKSSFQRHCQEIIIGDGCRLDQGVIIGGEDFSPVVGNTREELVQFPQMGGVHIGNNVTIKYNSMVGKGTFGYTVIGDNTMIDFGCQIGHNCTIGKSCIIAAGTIIGGSTIVGDNVTIGMGAVIRNGIKIGDNASVGMGAVVTKDVPANTVVVGNPAHIIEHDHIISKKGLV